MCSVGKTNEMCWCWGAGARPGKTSHAELGVGVCGVIRAWDAECNDWYLVMVRCDGDREVKEIHEWRRLEY
jgi:hypothetical protein